MEDLATKLTKVVTDDTRPIDRSPEVDVAFNGNLGDVDLAKPRDFVGEDGKIVVEAGQYSLRGNLQYQLWLVQGSPAAAQDVTEAHGKEFFARAIRVVARFRIYSVLHAAGIALTTRASDHAPTPVLNENGEHFIRRLYYFINERDDAKAAISNASVMIVHSFFANAIHRAQNKGHSWFTAEMRKHSSLTYRAIAVAGAHKILFTDYMRQFGHDGNHHLPDNVLNTICDAIAGEGPTPRVITDPGATYLGKNVANKPVKEILIVEESATDRWPVGVLGKAALIIGLEMMQSVIASIATKAKVSNIGHIHIMSSNIIASLKANSGNRQVFKDLEQVLGPTISLVYGYCVASNIVEEEQYMAFKSHAERIPAYVANGKALAQAIAVATPHAEAVATMITGIFTEFATSLKTAGAIAIPGVAGTYSAPVGTPSNPIAAEMGTDGTDRLLAALTKQQGDQFYNASG